MPREMTTARCSADGWSRPRKWDQPGRPATSRFTRRRHVLTFGCRPEESTPEGAAPTPYEISVTASPMVTTLDAMGLTLT